MFPGGNRSRNVVGYGRRRPVSAYPLEEDAGDYMNEVLERMRGDALRRRQLESTDDVQPTDDADGSLPKPIEVDACDFYGKDNAKSHHTEDYDQLDGKNPSPVFRRGEPFNMAIRFNRPLDMNADHVKIELNFGPKKVAGKGTMVILPVTNEKKFTRKAPSWDIAMSRQERAEITVQIQIPYTAGVGLWRMKIQTKLADSDRIQIHGCKENIYILFNPWSEDDPVYMEDNTERQEYVLSDVGKIYVGIQNKPYGRPWVFGQFSDVVLPASVFLLEKSGLDFSSRSDPVKVARTVAAMVNSNDDSGVLIGNWSGNYEDGTSPFSWTGSAAILEQYMRTGGKPVSFGQCWVFSGICASVCRALGIPCRCVTNFDSAHDTDESLTVDIYFDEDGNEDDKLSKDSIWNFHVWNDCWMARNDLPTGYGGWQAIDSTPQERSEGVYRAGPSSLVAIRRGEVGHLYDCPFVFAEVNGDVIHWQKDDSDFGFKKLMTDTDRIGRLIVTKKAGSDDESGDLDMEDISLQYKPKEGSSDERMAVLNAARRSGMTHIYDMPPPEKEDVFFKIKDIDKVMIGKPFHVIFEVENKSDEKRTVTSVLSASTIHYTGIIARKVKKARENFTLKPSQKKELRIEVAVDDYLDKLVDYSMLKIYAISTVKETQQSWAKEDDFQVQIPPLKIEVEGKPKVAKQFNLTISFTNPLNRKLEDCAVTIEGPGLAEPRKVLLDDVGPEKTMTHEETLTPRKAGKRVITAVFTSRQLTDVVGSKRVPVEQ